MDPSTIEQIKHIIYAAANRPFYPKHWAMDLNSVIECITQHRYHLIPVIRKQNIRDHWGELIEYGDFCDVVSSSGTTGRPVDIPIHREQENLWIESIANLLSSFGVKQGDSILQLLSNNDMFSLGPLVWQAGKKIGAGMFRCSPQRYARIADVIKYHHPTVVVGNPLTMLEINRELGENFPDQSICPDLAFFGACGSFDANNQLTPAAKKVTELWGIKKTINNYGCSEVGPIGHECAFHTGYHINTDLVHVELIDPCTSLPVKDGCPGEVVLTTLHQPAGFIAVRYATGDIAAYLRSDPCPCGNHAPRLGAIIGRTDQQLKIFGQTVFPDLIFNCIDSINTINESLLIVNNQENHQEIQLWVNSDDANIIEKISEKLSGYLAVIPELRNVEAQLIKQIKNKQRMATNGEKPNRIVKMDDINNVYAFVQCWPL